MKKAYIFITIGLLVLLSFISLGIYAHNNKENIPNVIEYKYFIDGVESIIKPENIGLFTFDNYRCTNNLDGNWDNKTWSFIPKNNKGGICFLNFKKITNIFNNIKISGIKEEQTPLSLPTVIEGEEKETSVVSSEKEKEKKEEKKETKKVTKKKTNKVIEKEDDYLYMDIFEDASFSSYYAYLKKEQEFHLYEDESITKKVGKFEKVIVLNKNERFAYVSYTLGKKDYRGVVRVEYIKKLPKKYIEVDISKQELILYDGDEVLFKTDVVTGKPSTPTPTGYYKINSKKKNIYLTGPTWYCHVDYFIAFIRKEYGLHDASWQKKYGGKTYLKNGSHGCVNIPLDKIKELYDMVNIGLRILIHE